MSKPLCFLIHNKRVFGKREMFSLENKIVNGEIMIVFTVYVRILTCIFTLEDKVEAVERESTPA